VNIIPAIDLKDNKCVRLSKGKDNSSIVFNEDPVKQAIFFEKIGCKKIHIVDLDAAFSRPDVNISSIKKIRSSISIPIQLGGGIRTEVLANKYLDLGIDNLIIGSLAVEKPQTVKSLSIKHKNMIYVSLDIYQNNVMVKGWEVKSKLKINDLLNLYKESEIKGYIVTDIENDGMLNGLNIDFISKFSSQIKSIHKLSKKFIIAGGLTNYDDLKNLKKLYLRNVEGIISGKSFYCGNIDLIEAQNILDSHD